MSQMPRDMQRLMEQAAQMQEQLQQTQAALAAKTYEASAGGGIVTAVVRGTGEVVSVNFDPSVLDPDDPEMVGDLATAAVNAALAKANEEAADSMGGIAGGLDLGSLGGLLG